MKKIIQLIKPRIIFANLLATFGGFFFAVHNKVNFTLLFFVLSGTACIIASGCIFNNIIDTDIDEQMFRTQNRFLIHSKHCTIYAKIVGYLLFFISTLIFLIQVNILSVLLSMIGFFFYVIVYSIYMKRTSIYDVIIGSIAGAMPPLIGYCAVTNFIDLKSIFLFLLYFFWQIPHSYSVLMLYNKDYKTASIPTIVVQKGKKNTLKHIFFYIIIFIILISFFFILNYVNIIYFLLMICSSILWLLISYLNYILLNNLFFLKFLFYWSILIIFIINFVFVMK